MPRRGESGFLDCVHELKRDGQRPDYARGEIGYTLGSMRGTDADGVRRRVLVSQAYGLLMLQSDRPYLTPVPDRDAKVDAILAAMDTLFFDPRLGLALFTTPIANTPESVAYVGRMGVVPAGCAENGEYHHAQVFMHRYRLLGRPADSDAVWRHFQPILSPLRGASLGGPFDAPCTSYVADRDDPHFGRCMYSGLSGSVDWIVEFLQDLAGLRLSLHDDRFPAVSVAPHLPAAFEGEYCLERLLHVALPGGGYRKIPLRVDIRRAPRGAGTRYSINGRAVPRPELRSLHGLREVRIEVIAE
jgi:hypothetical protein